MLACIKLRYAMRLPLTAAMASPCRVSLHLAAWAYLMFCQGLWCSCQEHSCSNSLPTLSLWQLLQKLYFQTNFFDAPGFGLLKGSFPFCIYLIHLNVYLLKGSASLWKTVCFSVYLAKSPLWSAAQFMRRCMWVWYQLVIRHFLFLALCCDVLLKAGNICVKCLYMPIPQSHPHQLQTNTDQLNTSSTPQSCANSSSSTQHPSWSQATLNFFFLYYNIQQLQRHPLNIKNSDWIWAFHKTNSNHVSQHNKMIDIN